MKKIILTMILFLFVFVNIVSAYFRGCEPDTPCCCRPSPESPEKRCYVSGVCCNIGGSNEYWDPESCYNFDVWVSGPSTLVVGEPTDISLYIKNTGALTDSYDISYKVDPSNSFIIVNLDQTNSGDVSQGEIKVLTPTVTVLFSGASGEVNFRIRSVNRGLQKNAVYKINESELFVSLPEFSTIFVIALVVASVIIFKTKNLI